MHTESATRPGATSDAHSATPAGTIADPLLGTALLALARAAIEKRLGLAASADRDLTHAKLDEPGATFITLTQRGRLRGCIGSLEASRTLRDDLCANAEAAAFRDPRFDPLTRDEWPDIRVEVSLLAAPEAMRFQSEADALRQLRPGIDGVILNAGRRRATFLPQVWESLPKPADFLARLKEKAGLPADYWSDDLEISRYTVAKWKEDEARQAR